MLVIAAISTGEHAPAASASIGIMPVLKPGATFRIQTGTTPHGQVCASARAVRRGCKALSLRDGACGLISP